MYIVLIIQIDLNNLIQEFFSPPLPDPWARVVSGAGLKKELDSDDDNESDSESDKESPIM